MATIDIHVLDTSVLNDTELPSAQLLEQLKLTKKRKIVFFDGFVRGYLVIKKDTITKKLTGVSISIDVEGQPEDQRSALHIDTLKLSTPLQTDDVYEIFKFESFIQFPKFRFSDPVLKLTVHANIDEIHEVSEAQSNKTHKKITSFQPIDERNLLDELNFSYAHSISQQTILSDSVLKKNKNLPDIEEPHSPTKHTSKSTTNQISQVLQIPIIRTLNIRIRNIKLKSNNINLNSINNTVLSTLDIEQSSKSKNLDLHIQLDYIEYDKIHLNNYNEFPKFDKEQFLPAIISTKDTYSFTHEVRLQSQLEVPFKSSVEVGYTINSIHKIRTRLIANLEFDSTISPIKRISNSSVQLNSSISTNPNSLASTTKIKFIGNKIVKIGESFKLKVCLQNNSNKERDLLMIFNNHSGNINDNNSFVPNLPKIKTLIQSNYSNVLKGYSSLRLKSIGILSLVNEIHFKLSPIDSTGNVISNGDNISNASNIFENEIELIGLELGVFHLQGVKLIDLNTGEIMSCDRLLEIIVEF